MREVAACTELEPDEDDAVEAIEPADSGRARCIGLLLLPMSPSKLACDTTYDAMDVDSEVEMQRQTKKVGRIDA